MSEHLDMATVVIFSALALLALLGIAVLLLIVVHQRRIRHRADVVEMRMQHAEKIRQVEREVEGHTLAEVGLELHDNVGQLLTALNLDIRSLLESDAPPANAKGMENTLERAISELRRLSNTLKTDHLHERPLVQLLEEECQRLHRPGKREVVLMAEVHDPTIRPDQHVVFSSIFQEALNNALKHAKASRITVTLVKNGTLRMAIQDNGKGYDAGTVKSTGKGLTNIRNRAALIGASCTMLSEPGKGTTIIVTA